MIKSHGRHGRQASHVKQSSSPHKTAQILPFPIPLKGCGGLRVNEHMVRAEALEYVPLVRDRGDVPPKPAVPPVPLKQAANEYLQRGWKLMRLPPRSKVPYKSQSFAQNIIGWDNIDTLTEHNLAVLFTRTGELKDLDLDYQVAADLARELGFGKSAAAFGRPSVGIGHYLFNAAGCEAKAFNLPEPSKSNRYPRELPLHDGKPSPKVLELRGNDNTYSVFPPSIHPSGETIDWVGSRHEPETITASKLHALAGRHAFASAVLYFYPETASARYDVRMALTGALVRSGMEAGLVTDYVQAVARLAGDPKWDEDFAKRTEERLQDDKKTTGLTKLIEVLQLPEACLGTFYEWLNTKEDDAEIDQENVEPVDLWGNFEAPPLPRGLLPKIIEDYAFTLGDTMGADPAGIAMSALTVCAASIPDDKIKLQMKQHDVTWKEAARIWSSLVGLPSSMKSPGMLEAAKPIRERGRDLLNDYLRKKHIYNQMEKKERKGTQVPVQKRLCLEDVTIESTQDVLAGSPSGVLLYQDELSGFFGGMDKYSGGGRGAAKDRGFWLQTWNGGPSSYNRVGRGEGIIPNMSTSMIGGIQPDVIRKLANDSYDDGFLQRTFMIMLRGAVIGKDIPTPKIVEKYRDLVRRLIDLQMPLDVPAKPLNTREQQVQNLLHYGSENSGEKTPLRFDTGAQELREKLERRHLELSQIESINKKLASHIIKYNGYFGRLCVMWHCIEHAFDARLPVTVSLDTAQRVAHFLHDFLLPHALAFYSGVLGLADEHERIAAVAGFILAHKLETVTHRDVQRGDRTMRKLERQDTGKVFEQLEALGWVTPVVSKLGRTLHWNVNPEVHIRFSERAKHEAERRAADRTLILYRDTNGMALFTLTRARWTLSDNCAVHGHRRRGVPIRRKRSKANANMIEIA